MRVSNYLLTMTAISVDRLVALLLGLRYRQTVTLERIYIMLAAFWVLSSLTGLCCILNYPYSLMAWPYKHITISANLNHLVHKDFSYSQSSSG